MRFLFVIVLFLFVGFAEAKVPEGVMNCDEGAQAECDIFWNRQSARAKEFILSFKGKDRNAALTCYALSGYKKITKQVRACTKSLIGERRSLTHCEKRGHELMSAKMEKCRHQYMRKNGFPLPY